MSNELLAQYTIMILWGLGWWYLMFYQWRKDKADLGMPLVVLCGWVWPLVLAFVFCFFVLVVLPSHVIDRLRSKSE